MMDDRVQEVLNQLTLEEKAALCSGRDFWFTKGVERLGIEAVMLTDGPHGLRKQARAGGVDFNSVPATCFPTAAATANSWDRELLRAIGVALGEECRQEGVAVLLGPGLNIKRSPLCGRNFEYFSEDPLLSGELAAAWIEGVQSQGVGASIKHFAVNNQEHRRNTIDAVIDARTLREIYLAGFERAIKQARPWTVMAAYNRVNGEFCSEHPQLLETILRGEWGFDGAVVSDWGACNDRVLGLRAGLDLEMPGSGGVNDAEIVAAVRAGTLEPAVLDRAAARVLALILRARDQRVGGYRYDAAAHHQLARRAAAESMVLLRNEDGTLPLRAGTRIAVIGEFARRPRYQGTGSSQITPLQLEAAFDHLAQHADCVYAAGYRDETPDEALIEEACAAARAAAVAVVFAGLPSVYESEGFDRRHLGLPASHNALIERVAAANPNTVVVLANGAPVTMPWAGRVKAILGSFLAGQAGGAAVADIVFGRVNPSGKLAESYPRRLEDTPAFRYFPGGPDTVEYREALYVGYRYYDSANVPVLFPFGHGLSYTGFGYGEIDLSATLLGDGETLRAGVAIRNTGAVAGAEVVQLYVRALASAVYRPAKELKAFAKVSLQPGEERRTEFALEPRCFACYDADEGEWRVEDGDYEILIGASSADIRARATVRIETHRPPQVAMAIPDGYRVPAAPFAVADADFAALYGAPLPLPLPAVAERYTRNSLLGELRRTFIGRQLYRAVLKGSQGLVGAGDDPALAKARDEMVAAMPLRQLVLFSGGRLNFGTADALLLMMNGRPLAGLRRLFVALIRRR